MTHEDWDRAEFMLKEIDENPHKYGAKDRAFAKALILIMRKVRFTI